jgi:hypothetical protein
MSHIAWKSVSGTKHILWKTGSPNHISWGCHHGTYNCASSGPDLIVPNSATLVASGWAGSCLISGTAYACSLMNGSFTLSGPTLGACGGFTPSDGHHNNCCAKWFINIPIGGGLFFAYSLGIWGNSFGGSDYMVTAEAGVCGGNSQYQAGPYSYNGLVGVLVTLPLYLAGGTCPNIASSLIVDFE